MTALPRRPLEALIKKLRVNASQLLSVASMHGRGTHEHDMAMLECRLHKAHADDLAALLRAADTEPAIERGYKRAYERLELCPDHRDKANGRCVVCQAEERTRREAVPPVSARLRELARAGARDAHFERLHLDYHCEAFDGHVGKPDEPENGFETCPHPDCVLVRDLAVSPPVPNVRKVHIALNVWTHRQGHFAPVCDGPDCEFCAILTRLVFPPVETPQEQ